MRGVGVIKTAIINLVVCSLLGAVMLRQAYAQSDVAREAAATKAFADYCAQCHVKVRGVGPELGGRGLPAVYFSTVARNGLRAMPPIRPSEIDDGTLAVLAQMLAADALPWKQP